MVASKEEAASLAPRQEVIGISLLAMAVLLGPSLVSHQVGDGTLMGPVGRSLASASFELLGLGGYALVAALVLVALRVFSGRGAGLRGLRAVAYVGTAVFGTVLLHLAIPFRFDGVAAGGLCGEFFGEVLRALLSTAGSLVVSLSGVLLCLVATSEISVVGLTRKVIAQARAARAEDKDEDGPEEPEAREPKFVVATAKKEAPEPKAEKPLDAPEPRIVRSDPLPKPKEGRAPRRPEGDFSLPDVALLSVEDQPAVQLDQEPMKEMARRLKDALEQYDVHGAVEEIHPGPVVTMYEFVPEPGTRLSKIESLPGDLAMALKATRVRVALLPGKGAVGVEIPNPEREKVMLKDILMDAVFARSSSKLALGLGKDIAGHPVAVDLAMMPHLLIAGATGTGKSVCLNSILMSLLYNATPDDVRLILVDPKAVELNIYERIPHLLLPAVTDPRAAAQALRWAVEEMERRYGLISEAGVRSLDAFNKKQSDAKQKLPYIVIVIDEFADLLMAAPKEVEWSVCRLAGKARAAGIHLVVATQRPSVDVITGLIKANFPVRIAFQVAQKEDSKVILGGSGAETLLGKGDMLLRDAGGNLRRIHGAFVSVEEVEKVVEFLRAQGNPVYDMEILKPREAEEGGMGADDEDPKYREAVALVLQTRLGSASMLQRRLQVGYNRAAKMIERMEVEGLVGPADGAKPREVFARAAAP
jgi:DNA segregation ATPase FtsK/SpoIIIE, S-DNA-T family